MSTLIKGGLVIDPRNQICSQLNLLLQDGRVAAITESQSEADQVIDAAGRVVTPGFVDIHMHEDRWGLTVIWCGMMPPPSFPACCVWVSPRSWPGSAASTVPIPGTIWT